MLKEYQKEFIELLLTSKNKTDMVCEYLNNNKSESEDMSFMSELINIDSWMFRYAADSVKENKSFIYENFYKIHMPLRQVANKGLSTYSDKKFLIQLQRKIDEENKRRLYKVTSNVFDFCNDELLSDKNFILDLKHVSLINSNFRKLSESLRDDIDIINLYIDYCRENNQYVCLMYFSKRLKNDKSLVLRILKKQNSYKNIEKNSILAMDKDIIKEALLSSKDNILEIPSIFLDDKENFKYVIDIVMNSGNHVFKIGEPRNKVVNYLLKTEPGKKILKNNKTTIFKNDMLIEIIHNILEKELIESNISYTAKKNKVLKY